MYKSKLCGFAIALMVGFLGFSPITAIAAETNTESVTLSDTDRNYKADRAAHEAKMKKANEKWNSLSSQQKQEVYTLIENQMNMDRKVMDKLVEFGVMEKEDAEMLQKHMTDRFNKIKASGEFPFFRQRSHKRQ